MKVIQDTWHQPTHSGAPCLQRLGSFGLAFPDVLAAEVLDAFEALGSTAMESPDVSPEAIMSSGNGFDVLRGCWGCRSKVQIPELH